MAGTRTRETDTLSRRAFLVGGAAAAGGLAGLGLGAPWTPDAVRAASAGTPKRGGTLIAAQEVDPVSLDPHTDANFSALQGFEHIYDSLTGYDEKTNVVPALAVKWDITNGSKTYTFHLRPNVKFHNGQPLTADDVKYSIDRVLDPKTGSGWRSWLDAVQETKVVDPLTFQLNLNAPFPDLLGVFASLRASGIMPKGYAERENVKIKAIGTGPFKLVEYVPQDHITYARNADYWDQPLPYLDGMTFKILTEETTRVAALRSGQIQYAALSAQSIAGLQATPGIVVLKAPNAWVALHYLNVSRKPLDDARVRRALRMAVDTNEVIQKAVYGAGVPSGPVPTGYGDWPVDPKTLPYLKPDLDGAKKLLAEAGYPNGGFTIQMLCSPQYPEFVASTLVVQDTLNKLNVTTQVQQMEWGAYGQVHNLEIRTGGKEGGEIFASANTFRPGPDGYVYPYFAAHGTANDGGYNNPTLEALMNQARSISNHDERRSLYIEIQRMLLDDSPNWWWYTKFSIEAMSSKLQGYAQSFTGRRIFLKTTWISG
ncbi:MAG TPA: ABC transporter substrate-binding protein [bacterium]|nr:ABC transporter substrate-binding protein [bacterium]